MSFQCLDYLDPGKRMVSSQCPYDVIQVASLSCHPSAPFFVIRVADTGMTKEDSVSYSDDKKRSTGMTSSFFWGSSVTRYLPYKY
ncbi:hypothetical protein [Wolbachia endosymbiont (group A) of Coremacera marginata]|uniref:hypothetical protein n=1 Tax=Wolbachia endosymbiont (group A) of Coremacera marginata TaxID=2953999 RepID=UPI0022327531|nr:hypothetical protein [Wolbachia endosymbiont (group A) of Coremacera marginata]